MTVSIIGKLQGPYSQAREANFRTKKGIAEMNLALNGRPETFSEHDEKLLEGFQALPPNLQKLGTDWFGGERFLSWLRIDKISSLNLIDVEFMFVRDARISHLLANSPFSSTCTSNMCLKSSLWRMITCSILTHHLKLW